MSTPYEPRPDLDHPRDDDMPPARVQRTPLVFGVIAVVVAAFAATTEITGMSVDLSAAQWMLGIGALLMLLGLVGYVTGRRR